MKFEPRPGLAVGRVVIRLKPSAIVRPDETKNTTKFMLLDAIAPDLEAEGFRVGDVVIPQKVNNILMEGGASFRPIVHRADIIAIIRDWSSLSEFRVQTESGSEYVSFDDPKAAPSIGVALAMKATNGRDPELHP